MLFSFASNNRKVYFFFSFFFFFTYIMEFNLSENWLELVEISGFLIWKIFKWELSCLPFVLYFHVIFLRLFLVATTLMFIYQTALLYKKSKAGLSYDLRVIEFVCGGKFQTKPYRWNWVLKKGEIWSFYGSCLCTRKKQSMAKTLHNHILYGCLIYKVIKF